MKQIEGQISITQFLAGIHQMSYGGCSHCVCENCLYYNSGRCPYGSCYDNHRAKENPYNKAHPDKPPRTAWSNWKKDQAFWCRGGIFYPVRYCENFVKYQGISIEECLECNIQVFQDGYISCGLKDSIGCEECIRRQEGKKNENAFDCQYMTDTGCERMVTAKNLILDAILEGEDEEICKEQCCKGCNRVCGYRCGQA